MIPPETLWELHCPEPGSYEAAKNPHRSVIQEESYSLLTEDVWICRNYPLFKNHINKENAISRCKKIPSE